MCCNRENRNVRKLLRDALTHTRVWAETTNGVEVTELGLMRIAKKEIFAICNHEAMSTNTRASREDKRVENLPEDVFISKRVLTTQTRT